MVILELAFVNVNEEQLFVKIRPSKVEEKRSESEVYFSFVSFVEVLKEISIILIFLLVLVKPLNFFWFRS